MTNQPNTTLERFFAGTAEHVFHAELGVADPPLVDYVTDLLLKFLRVDSVFKVRALNGQPLTQVAEMMAEANERVGDAKRAVHQQIGDFTLFWAGLYPEALRRGKANRKHDPFLDYCNQGKLAYRIASEIESSQDKSPPGEILHRLSDQFEMCAYGLREVRREWERRDNDESQPPFLIN